MHVKIVALLNSHSFFSTSFRCLPPVMSLMESGSTYSTLNSKFKLLPCLLNPDHHHLIKQDCLQLFPILKITNKNKKLTSHTSYSHQGALSECYAEQIWEMILQGADPFKVSTWNLTLLQHNPWEGNSAGWSAHPILILFHSPLPSGSLTLRHQALTSLDLPAMTFFHWFSLFPKNLNSHLSREPYRA